MDAKFDTVYCDELYVRNNLVTESASEVVLTDYEKYINTVNDFIGHSGSLYVDSTTDTTLTIPAQANYIIKTGNTSTYTLTVPTNRIDGRIIRITFDAAPSGNVDFNVSVENWSARTVSTGEFVEIFYRIKTNLWYLL